MSTTRREVRKLDVQRPDTFDEKLWPIQCVWAILVLYCGWIAVRVFSFSELRPWRNASVWLLFLAICYFVGISTWQKCDKRYIPRPNLLALLLSLIFNLSVLVTLARFEMFAPAKLANAVDPKKDTRKYAEYRLDSETGDEQANRDFQQPVEVGSPEFPPDQAVKRSVAGLIQSDLNSPVDLPADVEVRDWRPSSKVLRRLIETIPHLADMQGTISRQAILVRPKESKPSLTEEPQPQQPQPIQLTGAPSDVQRTATEVTSAKIDTEPEPAIEVPRDSLSVARRADEMGPAEIASAEPTLRRKVRSPFSLPNAALPEAEEGGQSRRTPEPAFVAATTAELTKAESASPRRPAEEPLIDDPIQIRSRTIARNQPLPESVQPANLPEPATRRAELLETPAVANTARIDSPQQISSPAEVAAEPSRPSAQEVARSATRPEIARQDTIAESDAIEPIPRRITSPRIARAVPDGEAAVVAQTTDRRPVARSNMAATPSINPMADTISEHVFAIQGNATDGKSAEPTLGPTAVTKAVNGIAGSREEPNFEHELPAKPNLLSTASASAKRDVALQQEAGPALAPSDAPAVKRARAEAPAPATSILAREVDASVAAGSSTPQAIDASSSSTIERAGSNALSSSVSASKGASDVDFGPTRIAGGIGQRRASGGGQPEVNFEPTGGPFPRTASPMETNRVNTAVTIQAGNVEVAGQGSPTDDPVSPSELPLDKLPMGGGEVAAGKAAVAPEPISTTSLTDLSAGALRRAESVEAVEASLVKLGGGDSLPTRSPQGRTIDLDRRARTLNLPAVRASDGTDEALPIAADNQPTGRLASGLPQRTQPELSGALAEDRWFEGHSRGPSLTTTHRRAASPATDEGLQIAGDAGRGLQLRRSSSTRLPAAALGVKVTDVPLAGTDASVSRDSIPDRVAAAVEIGPNHRNASGGLEVRVDSLEGVGGLLADPTERVGLRRRSASPEAATVVDLPGRFLRNQFGSPPAAGTTAAVPTKAFANRLNRRGADASGGKDPPTPKTEEAIELGLAFLTRQQFSDGSWSLNFTGDGRLYDESERATIRSDTAATGLALLAFLGAGYQHRSDKYQLIVQRGLEYLIDQQKENGDLYVPEDEISNQSAWLYSHAIAAIAICEAYGMTQDPWLREPAQKSLDFIVRSQNPDRGGWRYSPGISSDTSVTGWMMMALRSGQLAGLRVPEECFQKIEVWLDESQADPSQPHLYRYNPFASEAQRQGRIPSSTMTSVGLLMRLYSGWDRDRQEMIDGANYLLANQPVIGPWPKRDTYYWYYATQVMFHMGGNYWKAWNTRLHPLLVDTQIQSGPLAGSWNPMYPVADRWAVHAGRLYVTSMNLLSLEVYYRHLPIYVDTAK
jgi:hypothetical protein